MDWKGLGRTIAPLAPVAGSILGGFIPIPGGSMIGQKLGELIAGAFGVAPTPQAVSDAVATAGEETARAKINAAMETARAQIAGFVQVEQAYLHAIEAGLLQTGETMRAEDANRVALELAGKREPWFFTGWRPFIGWVFGVVALAFGLMLVVATAVTAYRSADPIKTLNDAWALFGMYFGPLGLVVGVYIPSRSAEKTAAIAAGAPMPNAQPAPPPDKPAPKPPVPTVPLKPPQPGTIRDHQSGGQ